MNEEFLIFESENGDFEKIEKLSEIEKYLDIGKHEIKAKKRAVVVLNTKDYKDEFEEFSEFFKVPGIFPIYFPDDNKVIYLPFLFDVNLYKTDNMTEKKGEIVIEYQPGDTIIKQKLKLNSLSMNTFRRIIDGNAKFLKTPEDIVHALAELLGYKVPYIYLELMAQQIFRCIDDNSKPCRLCDQSYKKCEVIGMSTLPRKLSWLLGVAFERPNLAIKEALINDVPFKGTDFEQLILKY
jgi:hypothetical protein